MVEVTDNAGNTYNYLPIKCRARQEVFEKVSRHLFAQMACSTTAEGSCAYRGSGPGEMCAAGVLLPDNEVNEYNNTGWGWHGLYREGPAVYAPTAAQLDRIPFMSDMVCALQRIHDDDESNWHIYRRILQSKLRQVALDYNLSATFLEDYFEDLSPDPAHS